MVEERVERDLKTALLTGETLRVSTLRFVKSVLLNVKVAEGKRDSGLSDDEVLAVLARESKMRQDSAAIYIQAGDRDRAAKELAEKAIIDGYLPAQLSEAAIMKLIDEAISQSSVPGINGMGRVIGAVKAKAGATADGAVIARLVKQKLGGEQK